MDFSIPNNPMNSRPTTPNRINTRTEGILDLSATRLKMYERMIIREAAIMM
jgi:hypothetical protein